MKEHSMEYKEFINLKLPIKSLAVFGTLFEFNRFCEEQLEMFEKGDEKLAGYEFVFCTDPNQLRGGMWDGYVLLDDRLWNDPNVVEMIQQVELSRTESKMIWLYKCFM